MSDDKPKKPETHLSGDIGISMWAAQPSGSMMSKVRINLRYADYTPEQARAVGHRILECADMAEGKNPQEGGA